MLIFSHKLKFLPEVPRRVNIVTTKVITTAVLIFPASRILKYAVSIHGILHCLHRLKEINFQIQSQVVILNN